MVATLWLLSLLSTTLLSTTDCLSDISSPRIQNNLPTIMRNKRTRHSLSIVNPLDVLRQRLLLEMVRRQQRENNAMAEHNRKILDKIGKRNMPFPPRQSTNSLLDPMVTPERPYFLMEPEFAANDNHLFYKTRHMIDQQHLNDEETPDAEQRHDQLQPPQSNDLAHDEQQPRIQMNEQIPQEQRQPSQHQQRPLYDDDLLSQKFDWKNY